MKRDNVTKRTLILRAAFAICSLGLFLALPDSAVTAATPGRFLLVPLNEPSQDGYDADFPFLVTPNEKTVVYMEGEDLFSVPVSGGDPRHLASRAVRSFQISRDGRLVVCVRTVTDEPSDPTVPWREHLELVSIPVNGGKPNLLAKLTSIANAAWLWQNWTSPDSQWAAYADGGKIFVAPLAGGKPQLVATMETEGEETPDAAIKFSPDSGTLLYRQSPGAKLFSVPRNGGTPVQLVGPKDLPAILDYQFAPDGSHIVVVFAGDTWTNKDIFEIYSFPKDGGAGVRLSASYERRPEESSTRLVFLTDGTHFVYTSWDDAQKRHTIVKVSVDGSERTVLVTADGPAQILHLEKVTGDDTLLFSVLDAQGRALYSTPITDGAPVQLTPPYSDVYEQILVDDKGSLAVLLAVDWFGSDTTYSVYAVPVGGGALRLLTSSKDSIMRIALSSDGARVFYLGYEGANTRLYRVPAGGGDPEYMGVDDAREYRVLEAGDRVVIQTLSGFFSVVEASEAQYLPIMQ